MGVHGQAKRPIPAWRPKTEPAEDEGEDSARHGLARGTPAGDGLQPPRQRVSKGMIKMATMFVILIIGLMAGPAVSL
jgi:hypothetical protein